MRNPSVCNRLGLADVAFPPYARFFSDTVYPRKHERSTVTAFDSAAVPVRRDASGTIHIGARRPTGPLTEALGVHGADVVVDLTQPLAVPYAVLDDARRALWWLRFVYGEAVTDEVRRLADPDEPDRQATPVAEPGFLAASVLRLAVGIWLWRWWPSRDGLADGDGKVLTEQGEAWLMTELGTLAWYAEDVLGGKAVARSLLADHVNTAIDRVARDDAVARPLAVIRAVIESVPVEDEVYDVLARIENSIMTASREVAADLDAELDRLQGSTLPVAEPALAYRGPRRTQGRSTVEWGRVRSRLLGAAEGNVSWFVDPRRSEESDGVEMRVPKGDRWEPGHGVYAAVYRNDADVPEALATFTDSEVDDHLLAAYVEIAPLARRDSLRVVVFDETDLTRGRPEPARTPEERRSVAAMVGSLLGTPAPELAAYAPYQLDPFTLWPIPGTA